MKSNKFGTFKGVFVPSTEAILGTVLFLLLPALLADVGLVYMLIIIILAHTVSISTAFSIADCATNLNSIGGGGMYALSRRSLGKAFGGSIGIQLYFAQAASISFYCIGFVKPMSPILNPLLNKIPFFAGLSPEVHLQVLSSIVFVIFFIVVMVGADFTLKIQMVILVVLFVSTLAIFFSPFFGIKYESIPLFKSMSQINFSGNRPITTAIFFLTFTQFFPAVVGIDAGVGMSGELKDPKKSLVKGTFTAIFVTLFVYIVSTFIFSLMDKNLLAGNVNDYDFSNPLGIPKGIILTNLLGFPELPEGIGIRSVLTRLITTFPGNIPGIIVLVGILFATSSSALSCFMTAPRTSQSLCKDKVLPKFLNFLALDFKRHGKEPRFATLVTFFIGMAVIWIAKDINVAAMIVGICFLMVYSWVNLSAFFERISKNPTFRPTSKGHWSISLYGFIVSITAICLFDWKIGILIIIFQLIIFSLLLKFKSKNKLEGVWWGVLFSLATMILKSLTKIVQGTKNWRPIVSVISFVSNSNVPKNLAKLGEKIAANQGLVYMNVIQGPKDKDLEQNIKQFPIPTNYIRLTSSNVTQGILSIIQASTPGNIIPNSILLEYREELNSIEIIKHSIDLGKNIFVLKNGEKFNEYSEIDIWWRGQENGNLMVLLAYIIKNSFTLKHSVKESKIRIIRKLSQNESEETAKAELKTLLEKARLTGEVIILPADTKPIPETVYSISKNADIVMMGMPGNINPNGFQKIFNSNEKFFDKELKKYDKMPAMLFVKSASLINLIEDYNQ